MKDNYKVYLSGPITGLSYDEAIGWTDDVKNTLWLNYAIEGYRPMRAKTFLKGRENLGAGGYNDNVLGRQRGVYRRDKFDVLSCDAMLVNLLGAKRVSIGTMFEMAWAEDNNKPVVLVMEPEGNVHEHMFVNEAYTYRVDNLDDAVVLINHILNDDM